ncbi:MAG: (d)CMP kinase [Rickettsiales bacterium]|jgi:cytidylate kinase|nr:(d)CMP kinase [Rickettsiales bacterium]
MDKRLLIAIDGPAASGKGTIARMLGKKLNLPVLYTGNIYRAIAYKIWSASLDPHDTETAVASAKNLKLSDLDDPNLTKEEIGEYASIIGSYPELRDVTYGFQRDFIKKEGAAVIEGRDIGTVICPEADYKFYITADVEVRAKRRVNQQPNSDYKTILADLKLRDERDQNRAVAPLKPADDAIIIDSSNLTPEETLEKIISEI